ncbi:MAG: sensory box/GGDEF family protein [uncultured bacterium]|nr:MAG: sensory box/GGDEF family protein [uncultured bacterium]
MIEKTKILVIDDDKILGKTLKIVLSMHGYDVCYANNGSSGIQKAFEYKPNLVLCDVKMGSVNGYSVYNFLKESSVLDKIPFIFISACNEPKDFRIGMDLGADDYISKPFANEELIKIIEKKLTKFNKLKETGKQEFNSLFNLTPYGIILFDEHYIYNVNSTLIQNLTLSPDDLKSYSVEKLLDTVSYNKIKDKIVRCTNGLLDSFREDVVLLPKVGEKFEASLYVSVYEKTQVSSILIGFIILDFRKSRDNFNRIESNIFSKREYQVLYLSMEGLSIKMIANELSISNRTVENHRENLMKKTSSNNMIGVITFALKNNLLSF